MQAFITSYDYGSETQTEKDSLTVGFITIKDPGTSSSLWSAFILLNVSEAELVEDWNRIWFCTISEESDMVIRANEGLKSVSVTEEGK